MKRGQVSTYTNGDWELGWPWIYHNNEWVPAEPRLWTESTWKMAGGAGTNMVYFLLHNADGGHLIDKDGKHVLVRRG